MKKILFFLMLAVAVSVFRVNAQVTVLSEGFETPGLPTGWTLIDANNDGQTWFHNSTFYVDGHESDGSYYSSSMSGVTPDDWLVTRAIDLGTSSTLKFWRSFGFRKYDHYGVYVSTTSATDPSAFTLLYEETLVGDAYAWVQKTVDLSNYDNSTVYIAFRHFNCTNQLAVILDDILVTTTMASPVITVEPGSLHFVDVPANTPSAGQLVTVNAFNLTDQITVSVNPPFEISTDDTNYSWTVTITDTDTAQNFYVRYFPDIVGTDSGEVSLSSGTAIASVMLYGNSISCEAPSGLSVASVTGTSAILSWTGSANSYNIYYQAASDTGLTIIEFIPDDDNAEYTLENLNPSTTYTWYVASVCNDGTLINSVETGSFTTGCAAYTVPFVQNFDASVNLPQCWGHYSGWASDVFAGGSLTSTTSGWNFNNSYVFGANHARLNIYGTSRNKWLVTPSMDLTGLSNPTLTFNLALTTYNSAGAITPNNQADDKFMVIISTDDGATWSAANATVWSNDGNGDYVYDQIPAAGQEVSISLADYADQTIRIAFYGESTMQNGDNDLHIDNVMVNAASSCAKPSNLAVTAVTSNSVTLSWTETGTATTWNIEYGPTGFQQGAETATMVQANTNPFTIDNLAVAAYDFYVQADCGDEQSLWLGPINAAPGSYNMSLTGTDTLTTCTLIIYDNGGANGNYAASCNSTLVLLPEIAGNAITVSGNYHTESCCDYLRIYDGAGVTGTMLGEYKGTGTIPTLVSSTGPLTILFHSDNGLQYDGFELNVSCTSCTPPGNLTASNISFNSADITWTGMSSSYLVEYKADNDTAWTTQTTADTTFSLVNLTETTAYTVNVYGNCGDDYSPVVTLNFITTMVPTEIPFSTDFSTPSDWVLNNGNCSNYWTIRAVSDTSDALFITSNGNTPGYNTGSFSAVSAEKLFTVGSLSELSISFDVQIGGETQFDYLKVFLAPADEQYPAATTNAPYTGESFNTYAVNFTDYLQYSSYTSLPYKFNLTGGNTVHVDAVMPNPNDTPNDNSTAKLVFLWKNDNSDGNQPGAIIHNVSIEALACPAPIALNVSNVTTTSADITWNAGSHEENWILEYREDGNPSWTSVTVNGTPAYNLTGLTEGTPHQVRVQAVCSDSEQSTWVSAVFTTFCEAITSFPYTEDFEHGGLMPDCWSQEHTFGTVNWSFQAGADSHSGISNAHGGSYNAFFFEENNDGHTTRLMSPILNLNGMTNTFVSYWYAQQPWGTDQDHLSVYYRTSPNDQWQLLAQHTNAVNIWTKDSLALPNPSATYQIAFVGYAHYGYGIVLDDITINGTEGVIPVVTNPTVTTTEATNIAVTSATLNATILNPDEVTITAKGFEWKATNGGTYTQITGTGTGNSYTANLTDLTSNTSYTYRAFISFNDTTVTGNEITFTTDNEIGIDNISLANSISLMPNPADNYIELRVSSNVEVKEAVVYNAFGQMIQTVELNDNHARIDLSNMASGMYFVRVNGEGVTATKKFIRKQ